MSLKTWISIRNVCRLTPGTVIGPNNQIPTESEMPPYPDLGALKVESKNQIPNNLKVEIITSKWSQCHSFEFPSRLVSMKIEKTI